MKPQDIIAGKGSLWIFGYGSLVWKPDFKFKRSMVGYVKGYKRRFWHGDNFHRGNDELVSMCSETDICFSIDGGLLASGVVHDVTRFSPPPLPTARKSGDAD